MASPTGAANDYRPGVIVEVREEGHAYLVAIAGEGGSPAVNYNVLGSWIKSAPASAPRPGKTATAEAMRYKVGDRVEADVLLSSSPQAALYKKATIILVDEADRAYGVETDALPGRLPRQYRIPVRSDGSWWIRPLHGANDAPRVFTEKLRVDANNTVLADRPLLSASFDRHGQNGTPPSAAFARQLVRSLWEHPSDPGSDGATTIDVTSLSIGQPRRWVLYEDMGQGSFGTLVYPMAVRWNQKTFYRTANVQKMGEESTFTCFVDKNGLWNCGTSAGPKRAGVTQEIRVVP